MKKTLTVNLGGTVFHIDEDAYRLLDEYLCNLKLHFGKQQNSEEIVDDIETRISELFSEKINDRAQVITIIAVEEVIARIGKPEELTEDMEKENFTESDEPKATKNDSKESESIRRRLFRNPEDKMIGGVISGMAAYLNWDVTMLRLIVLIVLICGVGVLVPVYLVCWLVIPEARTAAEKLSMRGKAVTVENIGKTVTDGFEKAANGVNEYMSSEKPRNFFRKLADAFVAMAGILLKFLMIIVAIAFSPLLFVLAIVFVVLVVVAITAMIGGGAVLYTMLPIDWGYFPVSPIVTIVACIAGVMVVGIPLLGIVFSILRLTLNKQPMSTGLKWTLLILWLVSAAIFVLTWVQMGWQIPYMA